MGIAQQQQVLAQDHYDITNQERSIANIAADNAGTAVSFLRNKFTNPELYQWMSGVVGSAYRYFLQEATALAKLAQAQLAFERQEQPLGLIADDYWVYPATNGSMAADGALDRRGLTGSARLLEDISKLDEHAFTSDQRKLQLSKTISLAQFDPYAFARFCRTGVLPFALALEQFDRDFPGQYLRLIKRVRVSVMALIPPTEGIKAMLSTNGISRVVISPQAGSQYSEVDIRRLPESVALTSPLNASGVFDLIEQPEMLLPFEGSGVASQWTFELPRAANAIDFANIADVLLTIDYTALHSATYRQQVVQQLGSRVQADRAYSLRYDFPDVWYDLHNSEQLTDAEQMKATLNVEASDFPPNLVRLDGAAKVPDIKIQQVQFYVAREEGETFELPVGLKFTAANGAPIDAGTAATRDGVISTRQASGSGWQQKVAAKLPIGTWGFDLTGNLQTPGGQAQAQRIRDAFKNDLIKDILFVISYEGQTPSFPTAA
jgi:Tc toxin complex TcA C-terminal TcB-binding domain